MLGPFVHDIDPIIGEIGGLYLWWYGASYSLGFLGAFLWIRRQRHSLRYEMAEVYDLVIALAVGALVGGRAVEVVFYEWPYYGANSWHFPAVWLGGMSTHGVLLGAALGAWLFCTRHDKRFLAMADTLAIAGAYILGVGRIGNFIDGQIAGSVTEVWWAVKFPDLEGYRHPVVLYDGIKNILLVPLLLSIRRFNPPRGVVFGHFILWYGFLRIFVDFFREYRTDLLGLPPGQEFNAIMSLLGLGLIVWAYRRRDRARKVIRPGVAASAPIAKSGSNLWAKRCVFVALIVLPLITPSDWTQDVPARYGERHEGLIYSSLYPRIPTPTQ
jgi:phosphatidylglycerol:prolipoprotein diacylglycerol transferase